MAQPTPLRPRDLNPMGDTLIGQIQENVIDSETNVNTALEWVIPLDSTKETNDGGTLKVPMSRIAMRDTNGLIPESMLPSYIDEILFGVIDDTGATTKFTVQESGGNTRIFESPTQSSGSLKPPENAIFFDTSDSVQYRWVESQKTEHTVNVLHGFTPIPSSKAITSTYGLDITSTTTATTINVKKPSYTIGSGTEITLGDSNNTAHGIGTYTATNASTPPITISSSNTNFSIEGLTSGALYHVDMYFSCYPSTRTDNIVSITIKTNTGHVVTAEQMYNMSSTADSNNPDSVSFSFDFLSSGTSTAFYVIGGAANNTIKATLNRISVVELI